MIVFFNTLGRRLEEFKPLVDRQVRMYTCGPTVWNYPHIGNYRTFLFEDLLRRFLKYSGYSVTQVMNLTDVDDRIIKVCRERGLDLHKFTEKYAASFFDDLDFLHVERAEYYPRATEHIPEMIKIIEGLLEKRAAYKGEDGSIYYKISAFPGYGKLSGLKVGELKAGARVRQDDYTKEAAQDFALWKAWDENDGKIFWESPLGRGRPGWHIECSAMSMKYLGEQFDIHTGGVDNIFPHHENEIAQSEAYTGKQFAGYWLHSEHLLINDQKMAKRLGNFITVKDLRDKGVDGATLRFALLSSHYRQQLNFSEKSLEQASASVQRINEFASRLGEAASASVDASSEAENLVALTKRRYVDALSNDLDTPSALAVVFEFISSANRLLDQNMVGESVRRQMKEFIEKDFDSIFAVLQKKDSETAKLPSGAEELLKQREEARRSKDWKRSDALRAELSAMGVTVQDTPQGQKWRVEKRAALA